MDKTYVIHDKTYTETTYKDYNMVYSGYTNTTHSHFNTAEENKVYIMDCFDLVEDLMEQYGFNDPRCASLTIKEKFIIMQKKAKSDFLSKGTPSEAYSAGFEVYEEYRRCRNNYESLGVVHFQFKRSGVFN